MCAAISLGNIIGIAENRFLIRIIPLTVDRFLINSTLGVLGLVDVASKLGFPDHEEDYGQTLAVWGVPSGPYIVLPLLGPSTIRDAVGKVPEFAIADPLWDPDDISVTVARFAVRAVDIRSRLLDRTTH